MKLSGAFLLSVLVLIEWASFMMVLGRLSPLQRCIWNQVPLRNPRPNDAIWDYRKTRNELDGELQRLTKVAELNNIRISADDPIEDPCQWTLSNDWSGRIRLQLQENVETAKRVLAELV